MTKIDKINTLSTRKLTGGNVYEVGDGLNLAYTIANQYIVRWHSSVLAVFSTEAEAVAYMRSIAS